MQASKPYLVEVCNRICIGQNLAEFTSTKKFRCYRPHKSVKYYAFCDDFGPMNMSSIAAFVKDLDEELNLNPSSKIVYCVDGDRREMTNAVFLVGAYMLLKLEMSSESIASTFHWLEGRVEPFRDATFASVNFGLTLRDCWCGLELGVSSGWVKHPSLCATGMWGRIDIEEYSHWDDPLNGDFHMVVPRKFLAFRGPHDLFGKEYSDEEGYRQFSPTYYLNIFQHLGVTTVVRLNEPEYDAAVFEQHGIAHHDLYFDDCTAPPGNVVDRFLAIADASPGVIAVHCKAGLGRTGTLIALYLMRSCGFRAREAMGWLRIMRPGSVIGVQQHYLCAGEEQSPDGDAAAPPAAAAPPVAVAESCDDTARSCPSLLAAQVALASKLRCAVEGSGAPTATPSGLGCGAALRAHSTAGTHAPRPGSA